MKVEGYCIHHSNIKNRRIVNGLDIGDYENMNSVFFECPVMEEEMSLREPVYHELMIPISFVPCICPDFCLIHLVGLKKL